MSPSPFLSGVSTHGHRGASHPPTKRPITFTTGFEREASPRSTSRWLRQRPSVRHIAKVVSADEFVAALPEIVRSTSRSLTQRWYRCSFVAREARKHRRQSGVAAKAPDELSGAAQPISRTAVVEAVDYLPAIAPVDGKVSKPLPEGMRGKSLPHCGSPDTQRYGNARGSLRAAAKYCLEPGRTDPHRCHGAGLRRIGPAVGATASTSTFVHLAARRSFWSYDKIAMANSLELRVPFRPGGIRGGSPGWHGGRQRSPVPPPSTRRRALEPIVPAHVPHRPKLGFRSRSGIGCVPASC